MLACENGEFAVKEIKEFITLLKDKADTLSLAKVFVKFDRLDLV